MLWIKPSGVPLATLAADDLVPLDRARLLALLARDPTTLPTDRDPVMAVAAEARLGEAHGRRPSVELLFHALLPERLVLHTHPILVNGVTCNADGAALATRLFGDRAVWVPYTDPGLPLAHAIVDARAAYMSRTGHPAPHVTLLGNHGLIVGGETAADIESETSWLVGVIEAELASRPELVLPAGRTATRRWSRRSRPGSGARRSPSSRTRWSSPWPPIPLAGRSSRAVRSSRTRSCMRARSRSCPSSVTSRSDGVEGRDGRRGRHVHGRARHGPIVAVVARVGLFATGDSAGQAATARDVYLDMVRTGATALRLGGVRCLDDRERRFIETWEAEAYRKQVAAG